MTLNAFPPRSNAIFAIPCTTSGSREGSTNLVSKWVLLAPPNNDETFLLLNFPSASKQAISTPARKNGRCLVHCSIAVDISSQFPTSIPVIAGEIFRFNRSADPTPSSPFQPTAQVTSPTPITPSAVSISIITYSLWVVEPCDVLGRISFLRSIKTRWTRTSLIFDTLFTPPALGELFSSFR